MLCAGFGCFLRLLSSFFEMLVAVTSLQQGESCDVFEEGCENEVEVSGAVREG